MLIIIFKPKILIIKFTFGHPMAYLLPLEGTCANTLFYSKCNETSKTYLILMNLMKHYFYNMEQWFS